MICWPCWRGRKSSSRRRRRTKSPRRIKSRLKNLRRWHQSPSSGLVADCSRTFMGPSLLPPNGVLLWIVSGLWILKILGLSDWTCSSWSWGLGTNWQSTTGSREKETFWKLWVWNFALVHSVLFDCHLNCLTKVPSVQMHVHRFSVKFQLYKCGETSDFEADQLILSQTHDKIHPSNQIWSGHDELSGRFSKT